VVTICPHSVLFTGSSYFFYFICTPCHHKPKLTKKNGISGDVMNKFTFLFLAIFATTAVSLAYGATTTLDLFEGSGSVVGNTSPIFGTKCVVEFNNDGTPLDDRIHKDVTVFKITDKKFLQKLKSKLSEVGQQIQRDSDGNESLTFFKNQDSKIDSWPHLNQYSLTANTLAVLEGDWMLRITFTLEKLVNGEFKIKTFYVIQGRDTVVECKI
jgi:hypothetical protein